jgi:hypothetical protein
MPNAAVRCPLYEANSGYGRRLYPSLAVGGRTGSGIHDAWLVVLSVVVAVVASYVSLDLAARIPRSPRPARWCWLAGIAFAMSTGLWSMHYIGMPY